MREARSASASDGTVLLQGESGSGKDYLARWIHDHSKRALGPYFSLNCAAISREWRNQSFLDMSAAHSQERMAVNEGFWNWRKGVLSCSMK